MSKARKARQRASTQMESRNCSGMGDSSSGSPEGLRCSPLLYGRELFSWAALSKHGRSCHFGPPPSLPWPFVYECLISFLGLICAALLFFSTCSPPSYSGPSGPVSKNMGQSEFEWLPDIKSCATWKLAKKKRSNTCPADEISISCASPEGRTAFSIISSYCSSAAFFEILPFCPDWSTSCLLRSTNLITHTSLRSHWERWWTA